MFEGKIQETCAFIQVLKHKVFSRRIAIKTGVKKGMILRIASSHFSAPLFQTCLFAGQNVPEKIF